MCTGRFDATSLVQHKQQSPALQQNWLFQITSERKIDTKAGRTERDLPSTVNSGREAKNHLSVHGIFFFDTCALVDISCRRSRSFQCCLSRESPSACNVDLVEKNAVTICPRDLFSSCPRRQQTFRSVHSCQKKKNWYGDAKN